MKTSTLTVLATSTALLFASICAAETEVKTPAGNVAKVAHIKGMDKMPEVVTKVAPVYPTELREAGVQGVAMVDMLIDSTGRVIEAKAVRSSTPEFAASAVEAAKGWSFKPAEAAGHKITSRVQVPFEFVMPQVAALERN